MTSFRLIYQGSSPVGFVLEGHTMTAEAGRDILCAAVSSAAYMAANTITDIIGQKAEIEVAEGLMSLRAAGNVDDRTVAVLLGLALHMEGLREEYPENIAIM